jgi:hypothetical protein
MMPRLLAVSPLVVGLIFVFLTDGSYLDPIAKAESVGYGRELEVAVAGLKEMYKRGIKVGRPSSSSISSAKTDSLLRCFPAVTTASLGPLTEPTGTWSTLST